MGDLPIRLFKVDRVLPDYGPQPRHTLVLALSHLLRQQEDTYSKPGPLRSMLY